MRETLGNGTIRRNGSISEFCGPAVRTPVPGPRSQARLASQEQRESNARAYPRRLPLALRRGSGPLVEDEDGNVFIDFLSGAGALPLGHSPTELVACVQEQVGILTQTLDFPTAVRDEFTRKLIGLLPAGMRDSARVHFCGPTGTNAVEAAIKLCKKVTGRSEVVAFRGGFHEMTHAAMVVSGKGELRSDVMNVMPGVHFFPFAYCHRCPLALEPTSCATNCAGVLEQALVDSHSGNLKPAAVIMELVQGEGGTVVARREFVRRIRRATAELDIPLIVDEVQRGGGRTGEWFAFQHYDIEPDVVVLSKSLSGIGLPAAVILYHERLDRWQPGSHTGTFRGNQLAFITGNAFIDIVLRDQVLDNAKARGCQLEARLTKLRASHGRLISDVRCLGLMAGVEFSREADGTPWSEAAARVQQETLRRGLILEIGGRENCVVRMLPPLNIDEPTLDAALTILEEAVDAVSDSFAIPGPGAA